MMFKLDLLDSHFLLFVSFPNVLGGLGWHERQSCCSLFWLILFIVRLDILLGWNFNDFHMILILTLRLLCAYQVSHHHLKIFNQHPPVDCVLTLIVGLQFQKLINFSLHFGVCFIFTDVGIHGQLFGDRWK